MEWSKKLDIKSSGSNMYTQMAVKLNELRRKDIQGLNAQSVQDVKDDSKSGINDDLKFENVPYGRLSDKNKSRITATDDFSSLANRLDKVVIKKKRTTLREEIVINNQFEAKIPVYKERKNFDLMRIVEDQVIYLF